MEGHLIPPFFLQMFKRFISQMRDRNQASDVLDSLNISLLKGRIFVSHLILIGRDSKVMHLCNFEIMTSVLHVARIGL